MDGAFGTEIGNGTWSGMIGMILNGVHTFKILIFIEIMNNAIACNTFRKAMLELVHLRRHFPASK